jgi:transposase
MEQATTIGLDIAKHVFQLHGADAAGHVLFRKRITRVKLLGFLAAQTRCVVAMEACAGAHYWAREIAKLGHRALDCASLRQAVHQAAEERCRRCRGDL